jgi:O-antigen ligase
MCLFWIMKLHLGMPTQAFDVEIYGDSTLEGVRVGTARGNANMLGPSVVLAAIVVIGWFFSRSKQDWKCYLIVLVCLAAVVPPLIGSGCRGAMVSLVWGIVFLLVYGVLVARTMSSLPLVLAVVASSVILIFSWHSLGLDDSWQEIQNRQENESADTGATLTAGRTLEWTAAWNAILASPIIGGGHVKTLSYQDQEDLWASHSTYLDAGLGGGFPGMLLFGWFAIKPLFELWRRKNEPVIVWFLAVYLVSVISIGSTSSMQLKHFWILWGMASTCFIPAVMTFKARKAPLLRHAATKPLERPSATTTPML